MLWGDKTVSWFDVWSFEHFISGMSIGGLVLALLHRSNITHGQRPLFFSYVLCLSYLWEALEHYLEAGYATPAVTYWFQGVEFWGNRMITDPLIVLLGACITRKLPIVSWPARVVSIAWLGVHVFIFPHCMYLQHKLSEMISS